MTRRNENTRGTTRDINAAQKVQTAIALRAQRLSWDEVAARSGFSSRGACHNAVMREMQRCISHDVEEMRREELAMLDKLHAEVWDLAMDKKNKGRLFAVDRLLSLSERRCRLMGLDLANKGEQIGNIVVVRGMPTGYLGDAPIVQEGKA